MSLRARLVLGIVVLMALGLGAAGTAGVLLLRSYQLQRVDQQLDIPVQNGHGLATDGNATMLCQVVSTASGGQPQLPTSLAVLVLDQDGRELCRLPTQPGPDGSPDLGAAAAASLQAQAAGGTNTTVPSTTGASSWRVRLVAAEGGYIVVAASLADADDTASRLALIATVCGIAILLLTAAGSWLTVRIGLAPLTAIEGTAMTIAGGDLSQRVPAGSAGTEVGRLATALNAMLAQIEGAFASRRRSEDRLRQFVADAGHELRTPLATIRGHAELYRQGIATSPEEVARLLSRVESESVRMGALVEDLLLLARLDASPVLDRRPVDLLALSADAVVDARAQQPDATVVLRRLLGPPWLDEPPEVRGDEARLRQILANLISNALRYSPATSPVEVEVGAQPGWVHLHVVDHGPGIAPGTADRVFERFYREDPGRDRQHGGVGLGLSIVASLAEAHGGSVRHEPTPGGGATFVLLLPVETPVRSAP